MTMFTEKKKPNLSVRGENIGIDFQSARKLPQIILVLTMISDTLFLQINFFELITTTNHPEDNNTGLSVKILDFYVYNIGI